MLNRIIEFSIKNKLIILLFIIGLVGYGINETTKLPIDAVPDITNNQVLIISSAPSYSAIDIERLVTFPIEQINSNIPGIKELRSFSRFGLSLITIVFEDNIDLYWARQQISERLQKIQIPKEICIPELGPISTGLGEIYQYVLRAKPEYEHKYNTIELRTIQDWNIKKELLRVKGVAEVNSLGGKVKQYEIAIYPNRLKSNNISITDVFNAVESNNQNVGGAYIEKQNTAVFILTEGLLKSIEDIKNIQIKNNNGIPLFIKDVADVKINSATRFGAICYNDKGEVAGGIVMMLKGANSSEVIKNVKNKIEEINKNLPEGLILEPFLDRTKMVNNAIHTIETNLMEGALIVVFILVFFLGNLRASLLVASIIPLSMLFAIIMMNLFKVSGNLMSLGALDFGLIIDGSVIIVEAVLHQFYKQQSTNNILKIDNVEKNKIVSSASKKMMNSAVFGQIIIIIVYLPIFTLEGIEGKLFKPMIQTVIFSLLGAFILSITYIPMMSSFVLNTKINKKNFSQKIMELVENLHKKILIYFIKIPKKIIAFVILLFIFSIYIAKNLGGEFIPAIEEGDIAIDFRILTGSNLVTTINYTQKASKLLLKTFPEIEKIVTKIGSGEIPTDPMPMEFADMMVILKDKKEWTSAKTFPELTEKMSITLKEIIGITVGFQFPVQMRFNELMTGSKQDVSCKIYGENIDTLTNLSKKLGTLIESVNGAKDIYIESMAGMPQIIINYNREVLSQYDLNISEINTIISTSFAGKVAGYIYEGEKKIDLVVRLDISQKKDIDDIKNLLIPLKNKRQIPLWQLANIEIKDSYNQIQRDQTKRRIIVGFNVRERDVESLVLELQNKVDKELKMPLNYKIQYGGAFENLKEAKSKLYIAVPIALVLIFILLFFTFNSIKNALLIYTAIPFSAIGGILFLKLRGLPFSISAGVGFIALFGVAVLNGIVLIAEFNRLKKENIYTIQEIIFKGILIRLRPVLMTAFVASLGFLPMAISNGAGAEVQKPLATVVIGGLFIATFLTLFLLPIIYMLLEKNNKIKNLK